MKTLCNCWKKSDSCIVCNMANLEDWNQIPPIAMSAETQRRLEEDLRFFESINVWHLLNLRTNPHSLYSYHGDRFSTLGNNQLQGYSPSPYHHPNSTYLQGNQYLTTTSGSHNHGPTISTISASSALPYPDLLLHASDVTPRNFGQPLTLSETTTVNRKDIIGDEENHTSGNVSYGDNYSTLASCTPPPPPSTRDLQHFQIPKEPDDYDSEYGHDPDHISPDGKKSVKFTSDTIFVERDMESPFWKAFSERRRLRRIMKQKKLVNAQLDNDSYQPSIIEIVKSAFSRSKENNNDAPRGKGKGGVLVYDNSSQLPETFSAQYVYTTPRRSKLFRLFTCQCCSAPSS